MQSHKIQDGHLKIQYFYGLMDIKSNLELIKLKYIEFFIY